MLTDEIARLIEQMLDQGGGTMDLRRNELAGRLGCVPSQITYVLASRFTPERGYLIESRRGGGGYIRIVRKQLSHNEYLMHFFHAIGPAISEQEAEAYLQNLTDRELISDRERRLCSAALSGAALSAIDPSGRGRVRADLFRHLILALMHQ